MGNRLSQESSPYLRQHADNPVDWYPWGEEALTKARTENKPILLSVGYSACHWCHVMEHESFENAEIAKLMNENYVNIKVDREERPDIDQIYQNVAQLMTRGGGWPLTVFLTPDLKPFFGGTYFPPEDKYGRPGFPRVLMALTEAFKNDPKSVAENAQRLTQAIQKIETSRVEGHKRPDLESIRKIIDQIAAQIDWRNGGFNGAPKFPQTMNLTALWRYGCASGFGMSQEAAVLTLTRMAEGGIYDQLGGGFHRYSTDEYWAVPHFEKMLYDNALLLKLYAEVLLTATPDALNAQTRATFERVLAETTEYVLREMKSPNGGFYSTQDADTEGEEGKYFVWDPAEVKQRLERDEAEAFLMRYGVTEVGNFEHTGKTVLFIDKPIKDIAAHLSRSEAEVESLLTSARAKLFQARNERARPARDEKIIASWNGLMISGLAWAARALRETARGELAESAHEAATMAMQFVRTTMSHADNRLFSVHKDGASRFNGYLDDYAFCAMAALDLARLSNDEGEIESLVAQARKWIDVVRTRFVDRDNGGFYFTSDDHETLIQRPKTIYDQAIPSGNSIAIECLLVLAEMTGDPEIERDADEHLYKLYPTAEQSPLGLGALTCAALLYAQGPVVTSGQNASAVCVHPHVFQKPVGLKGPSSGQVAGVPHEILVCHRRTCELPLTDTAAARKLALTKTRL